MKWSSQGEPKKVSGWPCQILGRDPGVRPWVPHTEANGVTASDALSSSMLSRAPAITPQVEMAQPQGQARQGEVHRVCSAVQRGLQCGGQLLQDGASGRVCQKWAMKTGEEGAFAVLPIMVIFQHTHSLGS